MSLDAVEIPESVMSPVLGASRRVSVLLMMLWDASDMTSAPSASNVFSDFSTLSVMEESFRSDLLCDASDMASALSASNIFSDFSTLSVMEESFRSDLLCDASDMTSALSASYVFSDFSTLSVMEESFNSDLLVDPFSESPSAKVCGSADGFDAVPFFSNFSSSSGSSSKGASAKLEPFLFGV